MRDDLRPSALLLSLLFSLPLCAEELRFQGLVVEPGCRTSQFSPPALARSTGLAVQGCSSPVSLHLSPAQGQAPLPRIQVTDLEGRPLDLKGGVVLNGAALRLLLRDTEGRAAGRPLLLNLTYL
ncbi:hypothetical protein [Pseudomonas panipatensis]|uniref:Fimbrial protein n=1 Tax=Pseudomonas panipatensis TaxID=428992 RepID=A0A1G8FIQ9_9PSED|nr:hypothetical protein [Pseudomonas panipatensis]SDH82053.1 hypothetical protein SAMN05216272_103271 [Pseudomonas panipatensis]SMP53432.1 hypothetical protein SAMN06295951_103188 [Pseudomonas panipatensis]